MTFTGIIALINVPLVTWFVIASWRRYPNRNRDVWRLALALLVIGVTRATLTPEPTVWSRVAVAVSITVWVTFVVIYWRHSGVLCHFRGHQWVVCAESPTGQSVRIVVPPEQEQRVLSELVPRLLGGRWSDAIIVSRTCSVCDTVAL